MKKHKRRKTNIPNTLNLDLAVIEDLAGEKTLADELNSLGAIEVGRGFIDGKMTTIWAIRNVKKYAGMSWESLVEIHRSNSVNLPPCSKETFSMEPFR